MQTYTYDDEHAERYTRDDSVMPTRENINKILKTLHLLEVKP